MGNSMMVIQPYRAHGTWVFDDPATSLVQEPFVAGIPKMIDLLVEDIPNAEKGFSLLFSGDEFPGFQAVLNCVAGQDGGNWYKLDDPGTDDSPPISMEGWLCPAFFKYFDETPKSLYVKAEAI